MDMVGSIKKRETTMEETVGVDLKFEPNAPSAIDLDEERNVIKKLDRVIMPLMATVYFFQCLCC